MSTVDLRGHKSHQFGSKRSELCADLRRKTLAQLSGINHFIMQLKDHFLFSACFKYFTNNEDVSGSEEAV